MYLHEMSYQKVVRLMMLCSLAVDKIGDNIQVLLLFLCESGCSRCIEFLQYG